MKEIQIALLLAVCCIQAFGQDIPPIKICVTSGFEQQCEQLDRESGGQLECIRVQDSVECAEILHNKTGVGFGLFSAESMLLLASLEYNDLLVLRDLRDRERLKHNTDFEAVVIVRANYNGRKRGLKGLKYCHPGLYYDRHERWSERFLKHLEREIFKEDCDALLNKTISPAEIEVEKIANYFGSSCRPGVWSNNPNEDQRLKAKYPQLCALCDSKTVPCEYAAANRHVGALNCLINYGDVAYVSLQEAQKFFSENSENAHLRDQYAYLCGKDEDYSTSLISENKPCSWIRQPWPAIVGNHFDLHSRISGWISGPYNWQNAFREILVRGNSLVSIRDSIEKTSDSFRKYRDVPFHVPSCTPSITWCTKSLEEKDKCDVIRAAGLTAGVLPSIECHYPVVTGTLGCLKEVDEGRADFTVIDSNYGYIARSEFNLTSILYGETDTPAMAGIVIREDDSVHYQNMQNISGVKACVNEYNGIASLAFIENGKKIGLFDKKNCNHSHILSSFFGSSCVPGALDSGHIVQPIYNNLCTLCPQTHAAGPPSFDTSTRDLIPADSAVHVPLAPEVNTNSNLLSELDVLNSRQNCNADKSNQYYGDDGALLCLIQKRGDIALLGLKNLNEYAKDFTIDPKYYRVICRNGTVANRPGFDVDSDCALASYVDSEVVVKSNSTKRDGIINALLSFDKYFRIDPDFKMYGTFDGHRNVLVNKGIVGWTVHAEKDLGPDVDSYNKLLNDVRTCGSAGFTFTPIGSIIIGIMLLSIVLNRLRQ